MYIATYIHSYNGSHNVDESDEETNHRILEFSHCKILIAKHNFE